MFVNAGANLVHSAPGGYIPIYRAATLYESQGRTKVLKALLTSFVKKYEAIELSPTIMGLGWWQNYIASLKQAEDGDWTGADSRLQQGDHLGLPEHVHKGIYTTARTVLAENTLRHHKVAILANSEDPPYSEHEVGVFRTNVVSILRGCRTNRIDIDHTFYELLLDIFDFGE
jgi:hypothetical protein